MLKSILQRPPAGWFETRAQYPPIEVPVKTPASHVEETVVVPLLQVVAGLDQVVVIVEALLENLQVVVCGETKEEMHEILEVVDPILPEDKPRYLMGVGTPEDLINGVMRGIDIFDCVLPTRLARHKAAFTSTGRINISKAMYTCDEAPIEEGCACYTCQNFSRAYLRHLVTAKEMLAGTLLSIHNLHTLLQLAREMRQAILVGQFSDFAIHYLDKLEKGNG